MKREDRLKVNKLKMKLGILTNELERSYHEAHGAILHYDWLIQTHLYCDYQCGKINELTIKAKEIQDITFEIDELENIKNFPTWNCCKIYVQDRMRQGLYSRPEAINKAAEFLTYVEERLEEIGNPIYCTKISQESTRKTMKNKVFISYSHLDKMWLDRVRTHFSPIKRQHKIEFWDDSRIKAGSTWKKEIINGIHSSSVAVLLISSNFFASDFIVEKELPPILIQIGSRIQIGSNLFLTAYC